MGSAEIVREAIGGLAQADMPCDDETSLFDLGVIDSFGLMELIGKLEVAFGVKVPDADLNPRKFESIARIVAYFDSRRNG